MIGFALFMFTVAVLLFTAVLWGPPASVAFKRHVLRRRPSEEAQTLAHLIGLDPEHWKATTCVMSHLTANIHVWIANEDYGVHWWSGDRHGWSSIRASDRHSPEDRHLVWKAVVKWRAAEESNVLSAAKAALRMVSFGRSGSPYGAVVRLVTPPREAENNHQGEGR